MSKILYSTKATTNGSARESEVTLLDNPSKLKLGLPKELGGQGADKAYNPEQLFAVAYSGCFEGALHFLHNSKKTMAKPINVSAQVNLLERTGGFSISVELTTTFTKISNEQAAEIVKLGHTVCPYSFAIKGNVIVTDIIKIV